MNNMKWQRFDLHHHTNDDPTRKKGSFDYEFILDKYNEEGITLICITNHNTISKESFNKYVEIINDKNYNITLLPGIEIEFQLKGNKKTKGHMLIIFNSKYDLEKLDEFFKDKNYYDKDSAISFEKSFPTLVNNLVTKGFKDFITIPHFAKGSNNIDYESIGSDDLSSWLYSFDFLEGNVLNKSALDAMIKSMELAKVPNDKPLVIGTDSKDTDETLENIKKLVYFLTEPSFEGLKKIIDFPKTRLSKENKTPFLLNNYIRKVKIGEEEINLSQGLNTIIGRRGSGKSYLLKQIIEAINKKNNEIDLSWNEEIPPNIDKITQYSQSQLTISLSEFMTEISKEDSMDISLKLFGRDSKVVSQPVFDFVEIQKLVKNRAFELLRITNELKNYNFQKTTDNFKKDLYKAIIDEFKTLSNKENIDKVKKDMDELEKIISMDGISDWLRVKLSDIKIELEEFKLEITPDNFGLIENSIEYFEIQNESVKLTSNDSVKTNEYEKTIDELMNNDIFVKAKKLCDFKLKVKNFVQELYSNNEYVLGHDIKATQNPDSSLTFDYVIKSFEEELDESEAIDKIVYFNCNLKSKELKPKQNKITKNYFNELFKAKYIPKVNGENIDKDSMGQKHEKFINSKLNLSNVEIILLDQPDDDLDSKTVNESIIKRIEDNYQSKQWIIVTHDPKIVLNTDSRNIILANYNENSFNEVKETYKNITEEDVRRFAYEILDARKEFPYRRGKKYIKGVENENN